MIDNLLPCDGEMYCFRHFYQPFEADGYFVKLMATLNWQEESIVIYGKRCLVPRLMGWYGDPGTSYRYSGVDHAPLPWTAELTAIKRDVQNFGGHRFNSVLANLYRDGRDSMGCHADDEKELGVNPVIASLSLGETRTFKLHHKKQKATLTLDLNHGDLIIMAGSMQHYWLHSLPKTRQPKGPRINLTFRNIVLTSQNP